MGCGHSLVRYTTNKIIEKSMVLPLPKEEKIDVEGIVLEEFRKNPKIRKKDIVTNTPLTIWQVNYAIKKLRRKNKIDRADNKWKII